MDIPSVFSIMFSAACALSLFLGIYTLYLNSHSKTNVLFFILTVTLDIWAFGFSMAVSADNLATVLFWRRFSAIGWGVFFSVLLHFFHVFTGNVANGKKRWVYILLYMPAVITYLGFTYFPDINSAQYNMVSTPIGWVNIAVNNTWDLFYTVYYIIFSAAGFYIVWRWGRKSSNPRIKKQSYLILFSFILTMVIGSLTDILGNLIFSEKIPQLAPLLMVFPAFVIYYSIKKYGLLNPRHVDEDAILMSDQIRTKITNYTANAFLAGGVLNFISQYLLYDRANLTTVLIFSGSLVLIGVMFQAIQRAVPNNNLKDILNAVVFSLIVPLITFRFINFAGVTIWAFPFILLIITLVFGKSVIQITLSISIIMTQIIVWLIKPEVALKIDAVDYIARIGMFLIAIWFANFVKKIYMSKLKENAEQISSQEIITEISSDFVSVNGINLDEKIDTALMKIGSFMEQNRAYIYLYDDDKENLICRYLWFDNEKMADADIDGVISARSFPFITSGLETGNPIAVSHISDILSETGDELPRFLKSFEKSFIAVPIIINNVVYGFLGMDAEQKMKRYHDSQLGFVKIIANNLADAFERIGQEKEITQMAFYDYLTKLPNRILFKDRVAQAITQAGRTNQTLSVIFLDLDAFKAVNDSLGHEGGDSLITKVAEKLEKVIRKSDTVSRFGGDEFLILLNNLNSTEDIIRVVDKVMGCFDMPFILSEQEFYVTASAGVAVYPYDGADPDMLIKSADIAMYKAKERGKNQYLFCTSDMKDEILLKMKLSNSLHRAIDRNEFILYYQPQVCIHTKKITGAEALVRWNHPEIGMISPGMFIPLAEQTGLISPIGDWVLRTACLQCKTWQLSGLPDIRIAVNVSVLQLRNPYFVSRVAQILEVVQLEPRYLELEITESAAINEADYFLEVLGKLKKLGVSVSIDDFGTQYSSLSRLTTMPIDRIKLDMQFIQGIGRSEKEKAIIQGIIGLAHSLDLKVIAEGVETDLQLEFLSERQCDEIQGYYFYRPLKPDDLESILRESV